MNAQTQIASRGGLGRLVLVAAVGAGATTTWAAPVKKLAYQPGARPRSVVFILSDDHRYDALGFMGHPFLRTPHMDSLAANGVHFRNALVTTALCSPSRASILTGLYTHKHRVIDNNRPLPEGVATFPEYLQQAGYATAFMGKWHMGGESDAPRPGFDHWVSFRAQGSYLPDEYGLNVDGQHVPQKGYITDELTDYAVAWLRQQGAARKPFFLYLSHKGVHANFTPAARHAGRYAQAAWTPPETQAVTPDYLAGKPRWLRDQRNSWHGVDFPYHSDLDIGKYYRSYCETLLAVDDGVGRILDTLKEMGILDETLVIYMGDNGFLFGEHGLIDKRVSYEPSIRIPLLMQCPQLFRGGSVVERLVANIDIAPTILDVAGLARPAHMDGASFLPLARGEQVAWRDAFLYLYYWEKNYPQTPTQFALRTERHKFISYYGVWDTDELYDLAADPQERINLIRDPAHRETAARLERQLYGLLAETGGLSLPLNPPKGESQNKRLRGRGGDHAADFPPALVVAEPEAKNAQ